MPEKKDMNMTTISNSENGYSKKELLKIIDRVDTMHYQNLMKNEEKKQKTDKRIIDSYSGKL